MLIIDTIFVPFNIDTSIGKGNACNRSLLVFSQRSDQPRAITLADYHSPIIYIEIKKTA